MNFRVTGIDKEISRKTRVTMKSPQYGHKAFAETATGYGPCRSCLKVFITGKEERILFTYNAFERVSKLPLPSPIFIHTEDCQRFDAERFPEEMRSLPMLFEGYGDDSDLVMRLAVDSNSIEQTIDKIFSHDSIRYINIRNAEAGCFMARIERD